MRKAWQMLATFVFAAALAASGHADPGHGNGGNKGNKPTKVKHEKPEKPEKGGHGNSGHGNSGHGNSGNGNSGNGNSGKPGKPGKPTLTSSTIDQIICTDDRILDLSGDYVLSSTVVLAPGTSTTATTGTVLTTVSVVQDDRGRLVGTASLSLPDGSTTVVTVSGHLQLTGQTNLRVQLGGGIGSYSDTNGDCSDDDNNSSASIKIRGDWDGTAFQTVVTISYLGTTYSFNSSIVPVNPLRGFIVESPLSSQVKGKKAWERRNVVLPWGNETVDSQTSLNKGFTLMMHSGDFGLDLRGTLGTSVTTTLSRAKVHLGYGSLEADPDSVVVLPAVQ